MNILRSIKRRYYFNGGNYEGLLPTFMQIVFIPLSMIFGIVVGLGITRLSFLGWVIVAIFVALLVVIVKDILTFDKKGGILDELREETSSEYVDFILNERSEKKRKR